ncbi:MAG: 3-oxoacyl-[acyl-carrier-protein] synthase III C-terminal domain-containing protein [Cyanobacteria bacterium P01_E01_bin.42]
MRQPVGIKSLAVSVPSVIRTNDFWRENYPDLVARAEQNIAKKNQKIADKNQSLSKVFTSDGFDPTNAFDIEMKPYLSDPFRGMTQRYVLGSDESALTMESEAARKALAAANMKPEDVDLMIVTSLFADNIVPGNAAFLAGELGLKGAAWNLESTCSSASVMLQTAAALIRSGEYRNVLGVVSVTYSRYAPEEDTLSWFLGDGAGAFVVGELKENQGVIATKILHTHETCGTFYTELDKDALGNPKLVMRGSPRASKMFRQTTEKFIRDCCKGAAEMAGVTLDEIDFFAFNTPTVWYANVGTRTLGVDPSKTINLCSRYANIGPVLPLTNLYHAAEAGRICENDLVLVYTIGSASNAGATVMRWGDVALGSSPHSSLTKDKIPVGATM